MWWDGMGGCKWNENEYAEGGELKALEIDRWFIYAHDLS
jgi:hypothetical protein